MKFSIKISGQAGQGVKSSGLIFSKLAARQGFYIFNHSEFPSLIRGGHTTFQTMISDGSVGVPSLTTDLHIDLEEKTVDQISIPSDENLNMTALGMTVALISWDIEILKVVIKEEFYDKDLAVQENNQKSAQDGFDFIGKNHTDKVRTIFKKPEAILPQVIINGNQGVALGAIAAGLQFSAIYPMSPISEILQVLAAHQEEFGYIYKQPEDEISAVTMTLGAAFAGARAMTATSGGGFCLMTEGLGLAAMTETPIVVINGMRPRPATGLPSWSEQGDLDLVLHHGLVLAASDAKDAFNLTMQAFNLADKYQMPVILLIDKNICDGEKSYPDLDYSHFEFDRGKFSTALNPGYKRYQLSDDGVSLRSIPGTGNFFVANADEHDEVGYSNEEAANRKAQMEKRMKKLDTVAKLEMASPELIGPPVADLTIVSWGSNKGAIVEAMKDFPNVNYLHLTWFSPFPSQAVQEILSKSKKLLGVEGNFTGQACNLIRAKTGIEITDRLLKYDGRPIYPEEIIEKIKSII